MKKHLILLIAITFSFQFVFAQFYEQIDFDSPGSHDDWIKIDTVTNPNNIWQIGTPSKTTFTSAYSPVRAIVTDTLNSYPANDTSGFLLLFPKFQLPENGSNDKGDLLLLLDFWFQMQSDSLGDYGTVEVSCDYGQSWINVMEEDTIYEFIWNYGKPTLTGNTDGWEHFSLDLTNLDHIYEPYDTLYIRMTFISDGNNNPNDGWIIDDFTLQDIWSGLEKPNRKDQISIYPNPSSGSFLIKTKNRNLVNPQITITDLSGRVVYRQEYMPGQPINTELQKGIYLLRFENCNTFSVKKIFVE